MDPISACAVAEVNGAAVIVSTDRRPTEMWDLGEGTVVAHPLVTTRQSGHMKVFTEPVCSIGVSELRGRSVLITAPHSFARGELRSYDLSNGKPIGPSVRAEYQRIFDVATISGRPIALTGSQRSGGFEVQGWDLARGKPIGPPHLTGYGDRLLLTELNGRGVLVSEDYDEGRTSVLVRDLTSGELLFGPLTGHRDRVSLAVSDVRVLRCLLWETGAISESGI